MHQQRAHFLFIARERAAGPPAVREAIRHEIELCERELATDLARLPGTATWSAEDLRVLSNLIVTAMVATAEAILSVADADPDAEKRIVETARTQLRMVLVGALNWRSRPDPAQRGRRGWTVTSGIGGVAAAGRARAGSSSATVSGRIQRRGVVLLALLLVHLLLHRGRGAAGEDAWSPARRARCSSARSASASARRPNFEAAYADHVGVGGEPGAGVHEDAPCRGPRAGRAAAPGSARAGAMRLTSSCSLPAAARSSSATGAEVDRPRRRGRRSPGESGRSASASAARAPAGSARSATSVVAPGYAARELVGALARCGRAAPGRRRARAARRPARADAEPAPVMQVRLRAVIG